MIIEKDCGCEIVVKGPPGPSIEYVRTIKTCNEHSTCNFCDKPCGEDHCCTKDEK